MQQPKVLNSESLRRQAEAKLAGHEAAAPADADTLKLIHELQVHQVELELQNAELRQAREQLEEALNRYVDFYDLSPAAFFTLAADGTIREVNLTGAHMLGLERSALVHRRLAGFVSPPARSEFAASLDKALREPDIQYCELELRLADDRSRHVRMEMLGVDAGQSCRVVAMDISEQKQAEFVLGHERRFLRQVIDTCPCLIFVKDRRGRFLLGNTALANCYGTDIARLVGRSDADFNANAEEVAHFRSDDLRVMDSRQGLQVAEEQVTYADGSVHILSTFKVPLEDEFGRCDRVLGVATDITARKQVEAALLEADRLKNEFLAMLGHELRNPLVPIRNAAQVLGRIEQPDERIQWAHQLISRQVEHLSRMVDDLLDLSRLLGSGIELRKAPTTLTSVVGHAVDTAGLISAEKQQLLLVSLPEQALWIDADEVRLTQVLVNLLRNAANYTQAGGRIELQARRDPAGPWLELRISDNGMGIAPELLTRIFDLFTQNQRSLDRAQGGLGIGLSLVRKVVELHGGRVEAHSDGLGQGATFTLWLPLIEPPALMPDQVAPVSTRVVRVLVVDDDPWVLESTAVLLQMDGHEVRTASDGESALQLIGSFRPQAVLLDIGMGGMDGYQVARQIRALPETEKMLLVALTGYGQDEDRRLSAAAGFDLHLVKPVEPAVIGALLAQLVG